MSRQLDNLRRIFGKLQARYGDDDIVSEFRSVLESREGLESRYPSSAETGSAASPEQAGRRHGGRLAEDAFEPAHSS